ncbi:MAG: InlB B-repeat-containing protein [Anaeroplasmataceae bacterium]|nr:InlB B-repeat-containing protein [Anaeroplasmataceae bacterium]
MKKRKFLISLLCISALLGVSATALTSCKPETKDPVTPEVEYWTVTIDLNDGSKPTTKDVVKGQMLTGVSTPTREGYQFNGWKVNGDDWTMDTAITANITIVAQWTETTIPPKEYWTVTIDLNDGSKPETEQVEKGQKLTGVTEPTREGYEFAGWKANDADWTMDTAITADITIVAQWTENPPAVEYCTVTIDLDDGSTPITKDVVKGEKLTGVSEPTREGFEFAGWKANNMVWVMEMAITEDITITALWTEIKYDISFNMHGHGIAPDMIEHVKELPLELPVVADEEEWRFAGWYLDAKCTQKAEAGAPLTSDVTLHASWVAKYEQVITEVYWKDQTYDSAKGSKYGNVEVLSGATLDTSTKSIKVNSGQTLALPRLKTNGSTSGVSLPGTYEKGGKVTGTPTAKGIKVTVAGAGKIHFYVAAAGSGARTLALIDGNGTIIDFVSTTASDMKEYTWNLPAAGDYYFVNSNGYNFYYIETDVKAPVSQAVGISVSNKGKVDYLEGMDKDLSNLQLTTDYENGSTRELPIKDVNITTDYDKTTPGVYTIHIESKENPSFKTSYTVTVYSFVGVELGMDKTALGSNTSAGNQQYLNKTVQRVYKAGTALNHNNLTVIAVGENNGVRKEFILSANATEITYDVNNAFKSNVEGDYEIVVGVTFNGVTKTDSYDVSVVSATVCVNDDVIQLHVDGAYEGVIGADVEGFNSFKTIQQALDFIGTLSTTELQGKSILLTLAAGTFKEKIEINYPNMTIRGAGKDSTIIEWDSLYGVPDKSGYIQTTDSTATVNVRDKATNLLIEDITISNHWNSKAVFDEELGANYPEHRALALLVQSDQFIMKNGKLLGYQDTLELFTGRQIFLNTYISGTTDFIFGTNNTTYFKGCEIHSITSGKTDGGYITAFKGCNKGANDYIKYGAIFDDCTFTADADVVANKNTAIARPWGVYAAVMIMNSSLDAHISTKAFSGSADKNCRYVSMSGNAPTLTTTKFFEYNNTGAGSITADQAGVTVLADATEAAKYADFSIIFATTNGALSGFYKSAWNPTLE